MANDEIWDSWEDFADSQVNRFISHLCDISTALLKHDCVVFNSPYFANACNMLIGLSLLGSELFALLQ